MLTLSHLSLARLIYRNLFKDYNVSLDKFHFLYGCIKPDFFKCKINQPHTKDQSFNAVIHEIENLCRFSINNIKDTKEFSQRLGIIIHYISDYFTQPHNFSGKSCIISHGLYEKRLSQYITNSLRLFKTSKTKNYPICSTICSLRVWITYYHQKYLSGIRGPIKDCEYIIYVSNMLALNIIKINQKNKNGARDIA